MNLQSVDAQLAALTREFDELRGQTEHADLSGGSADTKRAVRRLAARTQQAASRLLPASSSYRMQADAAIERFTPRGFEGNPGGLTLALFDVLEAFREDVAAGFLTELEASINAGVFADFLEMAEHVLTEIHRTPAAVIAGFTLEEQLRKMCDVEGVAVEHPDGTPKKAALLNDDLAKAGAFSSTTEAKDVTAWLGRRNDAAHGHHERYSDQQVQLMIEGVRNFISRHPA